MVFLIKDIHILFKMRLKYVKRQIMRIFILFLKRMLLYRWRMQKNSIRKLKSM